MYHLLHGCKNLFRVLLFFVHKPIKWVGQIKKSNR